MASDGVDAALIPKNKNLKLSQYFKVIFFYHKRLIDSPPLPGTATKNFTLSLCPWKLSWACAIVQKGTKLPGTGCILIPAPGRLPRGTTAPAAIPLSESGTEMITPLLVPIHRRLEEMRRLVMRTREKPNLPVPGNVIISEFKKELVEIRCVTGKSL